MLPFRKILFPVDYSEASNRIVPYVKEAVQHFGAELTLLHAYGPSAVAFLEPPVGGPDLIGQIHDYEKTRLRDFACENFGAMARTVVELGEPGGVIHNFVRDEGTDLVILPTEGSGPMRKMLLGSVTTKVLHDVSAAVWTCTAKALEACTPGPYKSIVCAVELGPGDESRAEIVAAAALAKLYGAKLQLVHVIDTPRTTFEVDFAPYLKDLRDAAEAQFRQLKAELHVDAPHRVLDGFVAECIREAAKEAAADLIVVGRGHAQGAVSRLWSHLYSVIREAPCPVLSI